MLFVVEYGGSIGYEIIIITSTLLYIGMCFYINDMVKDLRIVCREIDRHLLFPSEDRLQRNEILLHYIAEIQFHNEIFG